MAWEFQIVHFLHLVFIIWGVGGATISTLLMIKAEKEPALMPSAMKFMGSISKLIWIAIMGLIITGIISASMGAGKGYYDPTILTIKHIVVALIIIFGANISLRLVPKLRKISPSPGSAPTAEFLKAKKHMKIEAAFSLVLWYVVVALSVIM